MTQIKKSFALFILLFLLVITPVCSYCSSTEEKNNAKVSDVAEDNSVIDERTTSIVWKELHPTFQILVCPELIPEIEEEKIETIAETVEKIPQENYTDGWIISRVNVRTGPGTEYDILEKFYTNDYVSFTEIEENDKWVKIKYNEGYAYIFKEYISLEKINYTRYDVPAYGGYKSWMAYTALTLASSQQYKLQKNYAYTGKYGIRMVNDRYCVAIGSYFNTEIGQYFDLVLENGTVIPCIMGDLKADQHTGTDHIFSGGRCCSEFIIDNKALDSKAKTSGDISSVCEEWNSPVKYIKVYEENIFDN